MNIDISVTTIVEEKVQPNFIEYDINASDSSFWTTNKLFCNYIGYVDPLSYEEWVNLPSDRKAATLFVQFFDQIYLAWFKCKTPAAVEEDCVEEVLQYIIKNVPIIENNPKRFNERYLYRIAYNAIYCRSIDPYSGQTAATSWFHNTTSAYIQTDQGESCLFDFMKTSDSDVLDSIVYENFWKIVNSVIADMGEEAAFVVSKLCGGNSSAPSFFGSEKYPKKGKRVPVSKQREVIEELKKRLEQFADGLDG